MPAGTSEQIWSIVPRDTVFFGEGLPFSGGENVSVPSRFPPSPRLMQGVVRTAMLVSHGVDWEEYYHGRCSVCGKPAGDCATTRAAGTAGRCDDMEIDLRGPFLRDLNENKSLYPLPADLVYRAGSLIRLIPGEAVECDLGMVRLPCLPPVHEKGGPEDESRISLDRAWITEEGLNRHLAGGPVTQKDIHGADMIFSYEGRVGIARTSQSAVVEEGQLYSQAHVRLKAGYALWERVRGYPASEAVQHLCLLGGEKRLAYVERQDCHVALQEVPADTITQAGRFRLVFLQPALWVPPLAGESIEFREGVTARLVSACLPKPGRLGGWNMAARAGKGEPRAMEYSIPPGSVFFFETTCHGERILEALHDQKLGGDARIGFGHAVVGLW